MPAYLKFFELESSPFEAESQSKVVLGTKALRDALNAVRAGLAEGAARICVNGQSGMGKTSLARALPKLLDDGSRVAVILHPSTSWNSIRSSIAKQWRVGEGGLARSNLLTFARESRLVLVIDQAESASTDILDHLDVLLSYRNESDEPVVQSILLANLATEKNVEPPPLIWWLDRIQTLELQFAPLPRDGVGSYIQKHLKRAGWREGSLFTDDAAHAIHGYTGGIPGEVDRVCEQLLQEAAGRNLRVIDALFVHELLDDQVEEDTSTYDTFEELVMEDSFEGADDEDVTEGVAPQELESRLDPVAGQASESVDPATESIEHDPESTDDETPEETVLELVDQVKPPESEDSTNASGDRSEETIDAGSDVDESSVHQSLVQLKDYLSQPASEEELRAIAGRGIARWVPLAAMIAAVVLVGGLAMAWLGGDGDSESRDRPTESEAAQSAPPNVDSIPTLFADPEGLSAAPPKKPVLARLRGPVSPSTPSEKTREETSPPASPAGSIPGSETP